MHSLHAVLFFYITLSKLIRGDYECLCNYNRRASVFPQMNTQLTPSGHLYKFECKPTYQVSGLGQNWTAIQYKRQVKYVFMDALIRLQICPGYPENADLVRIPAMTTASKNLSPNNTGFTTVAHVTTTSNSTTPSLITYTGLSTERITTSRTSSTFTTSKTKIPLKTTFDSFTSKIKPVLLSASTLPPSTQTAATTSTASTTVTTSNNMDTTLVLSNKTMVPVIFSSRTPPITHSTLSELTTQTTDSTRATVVRIPQCPPRVPRTPFLKEYNSSCYRFIINTHAKWQDAENDCIRYGGHLVTIGSFGEQQFVYNTLRLLHFHGDAGVWIGFTDQGHENHWTWASGELVRYTYWAADQPSSLFGAFEDCALMEMAIGGHWNDYPCDGILFSKERHGWVCEYHKI